MVFRNLELVYHDGNLKVSKFLASSSCEKRFSALNKMEDTLMNGMRDRSNDQSFLDIQGCTGILERMSMFGVQVRGARSQVAPTYKCCYFLAFSEIHLVDNLIAFGSHNQSFGNTSESYSAACFLENSIDCFRVLLTRSALEKILIAVMLDSSLKIYAEERLCGLDFWKSAVDSGTAYFEWLKACIVKYKIHGGDWAVFVARLSGAISLLPIEADLDHSTKMKGFRVLESVRIRELL